MRKEINNEEDIISTRFEAKAIAREMGFGMVDQTKIATAISELTRNVINYAGKGVVVVQPVTDKVRKGIEVVCEDEGPGIEDIELAMREGYSTGNGLGLGLSGAKKLMDEFEVASGKDKGTRVVTRKWL